MCPISAQTGSSRGGGETQSCWSGSPACRQGPPINQPCMVTLASCCVLAWGWRCLPCWGSTALTDFCGLASPRASQLLQHPAPFSPGHLSYIAVCSAGPSPVSFGIPLDGQAQCPLAPSPDLGPSRLCFCPLLSPACLFLVSALGTHVLGFRATTSFPLFGLGVTWHTWEQTREHGGGASRVVGLPVCERFLDLRMRLWGREQGTGMGPPPGGRPPPGLS